MEPWQTVIEKHRVGQTWHPTGKEEEHSAPSVASIHIIIDPLVFPTRKERFVFGTSVERLEKTSKRPLNLRQLDFIGDQGTDIRAASGFHSAGNLSHPAR
jgi:hypothetical protein